MKQSCDFKTSCMNGKSFDILLYDVLKAKVLETILYKSQYASAEEKYRDNYLEGVSVGFPEGNSDSLQVYTGYPWEDNRPSSVVLKWLREPTSK